MNLQQLMQQIQNYEPGIAQQIQDYVNPLEGSRRAIQRLQQQLRIEQPNRNNVPVGNFHVDMDNSATWQFNGRNLTDQDLRFLCLS